MNYRFLSGLSGILLGFVLTHSLAAEDPFFSGPQIGEKLPPLIVNGVFGEQADKKYDVIERAGEKPVCLIFVHARTRPAFALTNAIMKYAGSRKQDGLYSAVFFLTSDATETEKWMKVVQQNFPKEVEWGISPDGQEGPGAYGLNRNVTLTVLVGKAGKVTGNFALVQPSLPVDGPKILAAIVAAIGSGDVPDLNTLTGPAYQGQPNPRMAAEEDPNLGPLLRAVINKQATLEEVEKAAKQLESYVEKNGLAQKHLSRVANTVVNSDKFENYGTPIARDYLKNWAKKYPIVAKPE